MKHYRLSHTLDMYNFYGVKTPYNMQQKVYVKFTIHSIYVGEKNVLSDYGKVTQNESAWQPFIGVFDFVLIDG